ncbi:hypothetical protein [Dactylosporangium sp. CA-139066]|uniref:hypothetical protein n=1 Tax=Dactylosporangium sp. CA-139066 TaxID=3239930 RepID=UPI003D8F6C72
MRTADVLEILGALGAGGALKAGADRLLSRRKNQVDVAAQAMAIAAQALGEVAELRAELAAAHVEIDSLRRQLRACVTCPLRIDRNPS